jgi:hypothetical protein
MSIALPTGGEMGMALARDHLYNIDTECFVDKLSTSSQNGCAAAYSTRLLRSNYYGPMVRVRRSTDNVEQDFYGDVFGKLGTRVYATGTSLTTWLAAATGYVVILYDQSGNVRNVTQTSNANQPTITANSITYSGGQWLQVTNTQLPTAAMTSNSSGGLVASASSELFSGGWDAWNAFDLNSATGWHNSTAVYVIGTGIYTGSFTTTDINGLVHRGEWLQLQLASAVKLNSFSITPRAGNFNTRSPRDFAILGSNNGTTWNVVHQEFNRTNWTTAAQTFTVLSANASYSYYRIVVKRVGNLDSGMAGSDTVQIMEWVLNPTTVPLVAGNDTYTYYATWLPTVSGSNLTICEQNTSSAISDRAARLLATILLKYGFNGQSNDAHYMVAYSTGIKRRTVMMCNHTLSTGNVEIYDEGVLYRGTTDIPGNLNIGGDVFVIGRKSNGTEYMTGQINEVIVTNTTSLRREALLYFTPTLLTKPRELFPMPKKMLTFDPSSDNPTPIGGVGINSGLAAIAITNLNLDLINVSNATAVSDWNGYAQATAGNRPVYYDRGGYTNDMGYLNFDRANSQHLNGGARTLNIATNGGLTIVALVKFTGTVSSFERIIDFGNGQGNSNILFARSGTSSSIYFDGLNATTAFGGGNVISPTGTIVQDEWTIFSARYTASTRGIELFKNNILIASGTTTIAITDRTVTTSYVGRSHWSADTYFNGQMGGLYVFDRLLSYNEMTTLANSLSNYALPNIPRHITEISNANSENMVLSVPARTGWSGYFNGLVSNYVDITDVPNLPMSYSYWLNTPDVTTNWTVVGLCDLYRGSPNWGIQCDIINGRMDFYCALPNTWTSYTGYGISVNTWYHVAICVNTNFQVLIYVNGSLVSTLTGTGLMPARSRFVVGAAGDSSRGYKGYIQDFRVYDYILRADEVLRIYDSVSMSQRSLQAPTNYLVNMRNWYSLMTLGKAGSPFTGVYVAQSAGVDPNVQYQLLNSTASVNNYVYHSQRIQDYKSFTCSFEIWIGALDATYGGGDQMQFFVGATAVPVWDATINNCNYLGFQVFSGSGNAKKGLAFFRNGTNVSQSHYSQYIGAARWVPVSITYNRGATEATWVVNMNGQEVIVYTDTNNEGWRTTSGNYWGISGWNGGATMTSYIRRVELTYVPQVSSQLVKGLVINIPKRYPESGLTANSSRNCVASSSSVFSGAQNYLAWKAFTNNTDAESIYASAQPVYNTTSGVYNGSVTTTVSGTSYAGEWLQIQLPYAISLTDYTIICRANYETTQSPNTWVIAGSNDGSSWVLLDIESNISNWSSTLRRQNFKVGNTSNRYLYFRMICTVTGQVANSLRDIFIVNEWELYGYTQFGVKYPIAAMTSNTQTFNGNSLGCGTYIATASNNAVWSLPYYAFDNTSGAVWGVGAYNVNTGVYGGSVSTVAGGVTYLGEWIQLSIPNQILLTRLGITPPSGSYMYVPRSFVVLGSNDNSSWNLLYEETNRTDWTMGVRKVFNMTTLTKYSYFRIVVRRVGTADNQFGQDFIMFDRIELYDDTTSTSNFYGKTPGLVEGLTWKYYDGYLPDIANAFDIRQYRNIGRTTNLGGLSAATNGQYYDNWSDTYSVEWTGYFRANATGTWTFTAYSDDSCYMWLGATALSGFTNSNYLLLETSGHPGTRTNTISLVEGVYYPVRIRWGEGGGADYFNLDFTPPSGTVTTDGTGYFFSSIGTNQAYPGESAKIIKDISSTNIDGVYYINVNGVSTATYCLMNDMYDGGGWMMLMKATRGTTFQYSANYWTTQNTLNATDTTRLDGDAKFDTFNYMPIKDIMAIWPDIPSRSYTNSYGKNGGSLLINDGWVWKIDNWNLYTPVVQQLTTAAQNALRGAYALYRTNINYNGATVKLRRYGDNVESDFYANLSGNLGTNIDAGGTSLSSWIGAEPRNVLNSNNWYSLMTRAGTALATSVADPYAQSQLVAGAVSTGGNWSYSSVPISTYANMFFEASVFWSGSGDGYAIRIGDTSANGGQGIQIGFVFWSGYSNNGFSGTGIYLFKNNVALAKSNTSPNGAGANTWFGVQVIYQKSTTNTWQVNINGVSALTYSDSNAITWAASAGNFFSMDAWSGGGLQISVWIRQLNLNANFAYVTNWYDQSGNGFNATQTSGVLQPIITADSSGKYLVDSQNTNSQFLNMGTTTAPIPTGSAAYTLLVRHGSISTWSGGFISAGTSGVNNQSNVIRAGSDGGFGYYNYWWNSDLGFGTNARPSGNTFAATWDGTTRRGYVVTTGVNAMTTVTASNTPGAPNVATNQQYLFRVPGGEYLNGQLYHAYVFNTALGTGDLSVVTNGQNYATSGYNSNTNIPQRITALAGFQISRDSHPSTPTIFNGFSSGIFPTQAGANRHVFGGGYHVYGYTPPNRAARWGFLFNNEAEFLSNDVGGGIGIGNGDTYSSGAFGGGIARTARVEMYGR